MQRPRQYFVLALLSVIALCAADATTKAQDISAAATDCNGFLVHQVESNLQSGRTNIRVLTPRRLEKGRRYPVVYVLPVEAASEHRYGDGLLEVSRQRLHDELGVIFVAPTFSQLPWYADHPTDESIQQEAYFVSVVVPLVEKMYPVQANAEGRLLLGFSKSGWGAWSLLLRHPDLFGRAAAWDAPLLMERLGKYGNGPIFGVQENFERYRIASLLREKGNTLGDDPRLILTGFGNFRQDHVAAHALLDALEIPHVYRDGPKRKHNWHSGWVEEAVELLVRGCSSAPIESVCAHGWRGNVRAMCGHAHRRWARTPRNCRARGAEASR
jgi:S-formylglutathione hydrolase FrmB